MLQETVCANGDMIQHRAHDIEIFAAGGRGFEALVLALEQLDAKLGARTIACLFRQDNISSGAVLTERTN